MRLGWALALALALCLVLTAAHARADDEVTIRTVGGALYRGEIVESIPNDHLVVRIATGSLRRAAWNEVIRAPLPEEEHAPIPIETIHTKDGSVYVGEIVEKMRDDHIALENATGAIRFIMWKDIDENPPPAPSSNEPEQTVRLVDGSTYRGEILERAVGDHVMVRISTGAVRTIAWRDIDPYPSPPTRVAADVETVHTNDGDEFHGEVIERVFGHRVVLRLASGDLHSIAWDDIAFASKRKRLYEDWPDASVRPKPQREHAEESPVAIPAKHDNGGGIGIAFGVVFSLIGVPAMILGLAADLPALTVTGGAMVTSGLAVLIYGAYLVAQRSW